MQPGSRLGAYDLRRHLGAGTQGSVWEAELVGPASYRKRVALKVLDAQRPAGLSRRRRLGGLLGHPNVVEVYDVGQASGLGYLAMEWVDGPTLEEHLAAGPLPPRAVVDLGIALFDALAHAHARGVVHRDVSPANVLLTRTGVPKLCDLGLAVFVAEQQGVPRAGTPGYVSPEQSRGQPIDGASDVWSAGAVLARAATGRHLLGRQIPVDLDELQRARADLPGALAAFPPLAEVLRACTLADPEGRPRSAEAASWLRRLRQESAPGRTLRGCVGATTQRTTVQRGLGNIVPPEDPFFGRHGERAELATRLKAGGVVTVHGPGGIGKTRLVLQVSTGFEPPGGAWFVELSTAERLEEICAAVAAALSVPLRNTDPVQVIGHALAGRPPLVLVLDNAEQAVDEVCRVVAAWARRAPHATIVVTSREVLGLPGESVVRLHALEPEAQRELFESRAAARGWRGDGADQLDSLLARVDGLPLAVELAAIQVADAGMVETLSALDSPDGETPGLHPAMSAALHASWALLSDDEQAALAQLTVFEDGFTAEAADAVLQLSASAPWSLDVLDALHGKALVHSREVEQSGPRFGLYVPVQQFASTRLSDDAGAGAELRHGRYFADLAAADKLVPAAQGDPHTLRELIAERANLLASLGRAERRTDGPTAAAAARALWQGYFFTGPLADAAAVVERATGVSGHEATTLATLHRLAGTVLLQAGGVDEAQTHLDTALRHCTEGPEHGWVLAERALLLQEQARADEAQAEFEHALRVSRDRCDRRLEARVLGNLGNLFHLRGRLDDARTLLQASLELHQDLQDRHYEGKLLANLALVHMRGGRLDQAIATSGAALQAAREVGNRRSEGIVLGNMGGIYLDIGQYNEAGERLRQALQIQREVGDRRSEGTVLGNLASLHQHRGDLPRAVSEYEAALVVNREVGNTRSEGVATLNLGMLRLTLGEVAAGRDALIRARTLARDVGHTLLEGAAEAGLASAALATDDLDIAEVCLERATGLLQGAHVELGKAACLQVELATRRGRHPEAREALELARACMERSGAEPTSPQALALAGAEARVSAGDISQRSPASSADPRDHET